MADESPRPRLSGTVTRYQGEYTEIIFLATGWQLVLPADPQRWLVRFDPPSPPLAILWAGPAGVQDITGAPTGPNVPLESKFRDSPAQTCGEWYAYGVTPVALYVYTERFLG